MCVTVVRKILCIWHTTYFFQTKCLCSCHWNQRCSVFFHSLRPRRRTCLAPSMSKQQSLLGSSFSLVDLLLAIDEQPHSFSLRQLFGLQMFLRYAKSSHIYLQPLCWDRSSSPLIRNLLLKLSNNLVITLWAWTALEAASMKKHFIQTKAFSNWNVSRFIIGQIVDLLLSGHHRFFIS